MSSQRRDLLDRPPDHTSRTPLVRVAGVTKTYRTAGLATTVLRDASLELTRGETTSLVGASGSGKSTLLSLIAGLLTPDAGQVFFDGRDTSTTDEVELATMRARRIGVVLQSGNLIPFLTAAENIELAVGLGGGSGAASRAQRLLEDLGLQDRANHLPRRLSGGEAQRVSLAMALANQPELLLADEVTGELDAATATQVLDMIFTANRADGLTVLFVTHSAELAARAQRRLTLVGGQVRPL